MPTSVIAPVETTIVGPHVPTECDKPRSRNVNLDALRGVAVLMVLGRHFEYVPLWTRVGWAGVDLFFVLSGFLISGLLFDEWKRTGSINIRRFYVRRALKLYPAFYALLLVTIPLKQIWPTLTPHSVTPIRLGVEMLFTQNYLSGIWGHTWSLAVEEHFYLALPLMLLLIARKTCKSDPFSRLPLFFILIAISCLALRIKTGDGRSYGGFLTPTHLRADSLMFGVLIGYIHAFHPAQVIAAGTGSVGKVCIAVVAILISVVPVENSLIYAGGFTLVYIAAGFLVIACIRLPIQHRFSNWIRPLSMLGTYSYSIYLWHFGVSRLITNRTLVGFCTYLIISVAIGVFVSRLIEQPTLRVRDKLFPRATSRILPSPGSLLTAR